MKKAKHFNKINKCLLWALTVALVLSCIGSLALVAHNSGSMEILSDKFATEFQALMQQYATFDVEDVSFDLNSLTKINDTLMVDSDVYGDAVGATVSTGDNEYTIQNDETTVRINLNDNGFVVDGNLILSIEDVSQSLGYELKYTENELVLTRPYATKRLAVQAKGEVNSCGAIAAVEGYDGLHIFQYATEKATIHAIEYFNAQPNVEWCEVDGIATATEMDEVEEQGLTDSFSYKSWGATTIGAPNYSQYLVDSIGTSKLKEIVVAVLDTGIDTDHPWFENRIASGGQNYSSTAGSPYAYEDVKGHGTHVSGIICDVTLPNVKILPIKVLNDEGSGSTVGIVAGINYATQLKKNGVNIAVINMSLRGKNSPVGSSNYNLYNNAIKSAYNAGILTVVASGNDSGDVLEVSPANVETAITVGSVGKSGSSYFRVSSSNYGKYVDLCAPGNAITSAKVGGGTISMGGTSMATPHVAAAVALLLSDSNKNYSYTQIESVLDGNVIDLGDTGWDAEFGEGLINLEYIYATSISSVTFSNRVQSHTEPFDLRLTCSATGAKIYYTQDGSEPTPTNGTLYTGPITIDRTQTITARAFVLDGKVISKLSDVSSMTYIFAGYDLDSMFTVSSAGALTGYKGTLTELNIPEVVNGITVVSIGYRAFVNSNIVSLTLPSTVTSIGTYAFNNALALKRIVAPGVTSISSSAFEGCTSLQYVTDEYFPQLETIGSRAFAKCSSLGAIKLSKAKTVDLSAFVMDGVEALRITSVDLPNVTKIGAYAFRNCQYLTDVNLPNVGTISSSAFESCGLTSINLPSATKIDSSAFKSCTALTTVQLEKVETIGASAFEGCIALNDLYLPLVTTVSKNAFASCASLTELTLDNLPSVEEIGDSAFSGCSSLTDVTLPQIYSIGNNAFENCVALTELYLPVIQTIGSNAFDGSAMQKIVIGRDLSEYTSTSIALQITIYGYVNTASHTYALEYGNNFVPLDGLDIQQNLVRYIEVYQGVEVVLSVQATGYDLKYAWYETNADGSVATLIEDETGSSMRVDTSVIGTYWYYVIVTNWDGTTIISSTSNVVVQEYVDIYYTISASASEGGSVSPSGNSSVLENSSITYTFEAKEGYYVLAIYVDGAPLDGVELQDAIDNGYTFTNVSDSHTVWVHFTAYTFTIDVIQSENGDILPYLGATLDYGGSIKIVITPYAGYRIEKLIVDGLEITTGDLTTYVFINVTDNHTISARFVAINVTYTVQHWQESLTTDGATQYGNKYYTLMSDTDTLQGLTNSMTQAGARSYYGFSSLAIDQQTISGNGDTVVNVYYNRNVHKLSLVKTEGIAQVIGEDTYRYGETVNVEAIAQQGYDFTHWVSSVQGVANLNNAETTVTMPDSDVTLTAYATVQQFTVTVTQSANGVISFIGGKTVNGDIATVNYGDSLKLAIVPNAGYSVAKLIVDGVEIATGDLTSYEFTNINSSHTFSAEFAASSVQYTVRHWQESLTTNGATKYGDKYYTLMSATDILQGSTNSTTQAVARTYQGFNSLAIEQQTISANGDTVVNVYYNRNIHKLELVTTEGISSIDGANGSYRYGEEIVVRAIAQQGYSFSHWTTTVQGVANLSSAETTVTMPDSNVTLTAYAAVQTFTITITQAVNGSISPSGEQTVNYGGELTLTISPNTGYRIALLVVDGKEITSGNLTSYTFDNVTDNHTFTAQFVSSDGGYTVKYWQESLTTEGATEHDGKYYKLYSTQQFTGKVGSLTTATAKQYVGFTDLPFAQQTILPNGQTAVNIYYTRNVHQLKVVTSDGIARIDGAGQYKYGATVKVTAVMQQGYNFSRWASTVQGVANLSSAETTVTMPDQDVTLTAYATVQTFTITVTQSANGNISSDKVTVNYGQDVTLTFTPNQGYHVESIVINGSTVEGAQTYTLTSVKQNYTVTATFAKNQSVGPDLPGDASYTVNHWQESLTTDGAIEHDGKYYTLHNTQQLTGKVGALTNATADSYVGFTALSFAQQTISSGGDTEVNVYYTRNEYKLKLVTTKGVEKVMGEGTYKFGEKVNVEAIAQQGYNFTHWVSSFNGITNLDEARLAFTMPDQDVTLTAYATIQTFTVTVVQSSNGSISPVGEVTVNYGKRVTLTFTPNEGYHVESIVINGETINGAKTYTLKSVDQDYTVTAIFAKDEPADGPEKPDKPAVAWYWWASGPAVVAVVFVIVLIVKKKKII